LVTAAFEFGITSPFCYFVILYWCSVNLVCSGNPFLIRQKANQKRL